MDDRDKRMFLAHPGTDFAESDLWGQTAKQPDVDVKVSGAPPMLEVTLRPKGFHGVKVEEITLGAPLAS